MRFSARGAILVLAVLVFPSGSRPGAEELRETTWSFSGEARFRPEWRDNADLNSAVDDDLRQGFMRLRLGVTGKVRDDVTLFVQAQDSRVAGEETSTASNQKNLDLHQGYVAAALGAAKSLTLTLGRQEWAYGDHRLIGNFVWDNVGRAFDGARLRFARARFFLDGLLARITSRPSGGGGSTGSDLYGLYAQAAPRKGAEYEGYWLAYADDLLAAGETGAPGKTRINAVGGRAKDRLGRFDFVAEAVLERGDFRGDSLRAHAAAGQAGLTWGQGVKVRTFGGYDFATGDRNPADGRREEFFNFFPTNHPHYGYMDYEGWRNLKSPYGGIGVTRGRHYVQAKVHRFALEQARGPWKNAGGDVLGSDPTGASGSQVGRELDLTYRLAWRDRTTVECGYSRFEPGRFARRTRGGDPSGWAYVMLTFGF
ncbi:MAG TPA: alginate export family protein [Candidatus Polarisedimenticolia bacterium]|nr:alginate export family protein [Candidatus Polarisedimenticolia bacterium]